MKSFRIFFEAVFYLLIILCFLSVGEQLSGHIHLRTAVCFLAVILYFLSGFSISSWRKPSFILFWIFCFYELLRAGLAFYLLHDPVPDAATQVLSLKRYLSAPQIWLSYTAAFSLGYFGFAHRERAERFLKMIAWTAFALAVNAIPIRLLKGGGHFIEGNFGYLYNGQDIAFFIRSFIFTK